MIVSDSITCPVADQLYFPSVVASCARHEAPGNPKKPSTSRHKKIHKDGKSKGSFMFPADDCPVCKKKLFICQEKIVEAILIGSKTITDVNTVSNMCRNTVRHNLITLGKELTNNMSLEEMRATVAFFVTSKTAFSIPFLELTYLRLLRGFRQDVVSESFFCVPSKALLLPKGPQSRRSAATLATSRRT